MVGARTSTTHPLRVDFVDTADLKLPGRLGLTFAPGKKQRHAQTGSWDRDLEIDLRALKNEGSREAKHLIGSAKLLKCNS